MFFVYTGLPGRTARARRLRHVRWTRKVRAVDSRLAIINTGTPVRSGLAIKDESLSLILRYEEFEWHCFYAAQD